MHQLNKLMIHKNHYYLVMCDEDGRDLILNGMNSKFFVKMIKGFKNSKNQSQNWIVTSNNFLKKELKSGLNVPFEIKKWTTLVKTRNN